MRIAVINEATAADHNAAESWHSRDEGSTS
jgi:hypothetical protein